LRNGSEGADGSPASIGALCGVATVGAGWKGAEAIGPSTRGQCATRPVLRRRRSGTVGGSVWSVPHARTDCCLPSRRVCCGTGDSGAVPLGHSVPQRRTLGKLGGWECVRRRWAGWGRGERAARDRTPPARGKTSAQS
jgi:hypothetical protein